MRNPHASNKLDDGIHGRFISEDVLNIVDNSATRVYLQVQKSMGERRISEPWKKNGAGCERGIALNPECWRLKVVRCSCRNDCDTRMCSCKKHGLEFSVAYVWWMQGYQQHELVHVSHRGCWRHSLTESGVSNSEVCVPMCIFIVPVYMHVICVSLYAKHSQ